VFLFKIFLKLFVQRKNCIIFILKNSDQDLLHKDDHEMLCKVFTYEHYSKDPLLLVKKIEYDIRMVGGKLLNFSKLKLNDFHFVEIKNENGQIEQFYHNNKDYSSTDQKGRSKNKFKYDIKLRFDGTPNCPGTSFKFYLSKIPPTALGNPDCPLLLKPDASTDQLFWFSPDSTHPAEWRKNFFLVYKPMSRRGKTKMGLIRKDPDYPMVQLIRKTLNLPDFTFKTQNISNLSITRFAQSRNEESHATHPSV